VDRRVFLALGVLAAAAGSPAFAEQVRVAGEKGKMLHINRDMLILAIYTVALSRNAQAVGVNALTKLGHNRDEARQMTTLAISIARKSKTAKNFKMLVDGRSSAGIMLDEREMALLRRVGSSTGGEGGIWGRTWEGSEMIAAPRPGRPATVWDGRTWEGSSAR